MTTIVLQTEFDPCGRYIHVHPNAISHALGYIPHWLFNPEFDESSIVEAIDAQYQHGGGWIPCEGFEHKGKGILAYPGDPDLFPLARYERTTPNGKTEVAYQYPHSFVMAMNDDGSIRVARID